MHTYGFSVNTADRNDVVAFWHAVYQASEGYETRVGWTGNYTGNSGTTSGAFQDDVERRLNYFRAMCGVPASTTVNSGSTVVIETPDPFKPASNTLKSAAAQDAALMLIQNYNPTTGANPAATHNPASNLVGWSAAAWNAAAKGNFSFGVYGPTAINEYMIEEQSSSSQGSVWNVLVGHRRWTLFPTATDFATGDQPGSTASRPPTNIFYILQKPAELRPPPAVGFVAYPAAGFFPAPVNSRYWSVSRAGANFSGATVSMTNSAGTAIPVKAITRSNDYGDPAIIWEVDPSAAVKSVSADTRFDVMVSGVSGAGVPTSFGYSVTLINPDRINSVQSISGSASLAPTGSATYSFAPPVGAEGVQMVTYRKNPVVWTETGEDAAKSKVIDKTSLAYPLIARGKSFPGFGSISGAASFRLTFPTPYDIIKRGAPDQIFEIDRQIVPNSKATLNFKFRRGYMTKTTVMAAEYSADGGVVWKSLGTIKGVSDRLYDKAAAAASFPLPKSAAPILVRFRLFSGGSAIFAHDAAPTSPTGIFIDDITTKGCHWHEPMKITTLPATASSWEFKKQSAGTTLKKGDEWHLRLRTKLGGKWFPPGPAKAVKIK